MHLFSHIKMIISPHYCIKTPNTAIATCLLALEPHANLAYINLSRRLYIFIDASDLLWSGVAHQVSMPDIAFSVANPRPQLQVFLLEYPKNFKGRRTILGVDAYAIKRKGDRKQGSLASDHSLSKDTDQDKLLVQWNPTKVIADLSYALILNFFAGSFACVYKYENKCEWSFTDIVTSDRLKWLRLFLRAWHGRARWLRRL